MRIIAGSWPVTPAKAGDKRVITLGVQAGIVRKLKRAVSVAGSGPLCMLAALALGDLLQHNKTCYAGATHPKKEQIISNGPIEKQ